MKSVILLLTLSILNFLVQGTSSASPRAIAPLRSNYGGSATNQYKPPNKQGYGGDDDDYQSPSFFPGNAMLLFQLKSSIQSSLHKIEDDEEALERVNEEIKLLYGLTKALFSFYENGVEGLITQCVIYGSGELPNAIKIGNKCYVISDTKAGLLPPATFLEARQVCLAHGGDLASPFLLPGSSFGVDLEEGFEEAIEEEILDSSGGGASNYWINGFASEESLGHPIVTSSGFTIPNYSPLYSSMNMPPYANVEIDAPSGLTFVGPILSNEVKWYIEPVFFENPLPYICEFPTAFNLVGFSGDDLEDKFRTIKSSLLQKFLQKVKRLNEIKKSMISTSLKDANNKNTEHEQTDAPTKEPQSVKDSGKVENEKQIVEQILKQETKPDEVVKMVELAKPVIVPEVMKKDEPFKIKKVVEDLPIKEKEAMKVVEELPIKEKEAMKVVEELPIKEKEAMKVVEELPIKEKEAMKVVEAIPNGEVVEEGDKNVNEKNLLLEDILGKLEQLESFRGLKQ